jgi:transposase
VNSARTALPAQPVNALTGGIDWARDGHAVSVVDARGCELHRCTIEHSAAGLSQLVAVLERIGVQEVAIKRPDGPVIDALLAAGITVVVISPNQLKNLRGRYAVPHARLIAAPRGATGAAAAAQAHTTTALLAVLTSLVEQIKTLSTQISRQLAAHADQHIFTSLPRAGRIRAACLLAEIDHCRARFPTPESLACLAGAAPSTRQSGKQRSVGFRWACDKQLRDTVTDFAADSPYANPWAADLYHRARARGHDHPHAVRILARA